MIKRLEFLRDIWRLARPYWFSEDRWAGRGLLAVIVCMSLTLVFITVLLNQWNNAFYDSLQNRDLDGFYRQLGYFCLLAFAYIVVAVYQLYLNQMLQIRWRRWLTERHLEQWLKDRVYYDLQTRGSATDNPDQRMADDIGAFVTQTLTLTLGFLEAVVSLASFIGILWGLSGSLEFTLWDRAFSVPGYMVWVALCYAVLGTWLTKRVGRPLVTLNFNQQRYEADFRFSLVRLRENAEGVALISGEADEAGIFRARFANVVQNWWAIMRRRKALAWLTNSYAQAAVVFPFLAAAPRYFSGAIQLGGLMQTASAFARVQGALSWFVDAFTELASWKATVDRLTTFRRAMDEARARRENPDALRSEVGAWPVLDLLDVDIDLPGGEPLLRGVHLRVEPGDTLLVTGPTGSGKSTLLRAVAGLWPEGRGRILLPGDHSLMFLPQRPYLPLGTLRQTLSYPSPHEGIPDEAMRQALALCGLERLGERLDHTAYWPQELSPGEQQRLAFARLILQAPDFVFLDEATSAVDEAGEEALYALLRETLPHAAVVSVGHRGTLEAFHARRLALTGGRPGTARLVESH
ncbi:Vitamin B12 transport ATP-binding protein BacA [Fundidesulfovibrio magnetotacticus]|uniref:Vitamin B12 transport ATP-binding protein BacA n=1 Tax=Fundidesulfovibrio magnetotacticus TaxID=2730080 RepID=A0A6V8LTI0_9BACT|nr:ABC transporter ATP-binding protein/permease [Fundidesulfovibrio magnetotacticus]GFK93399.1 Vitamin B12 transport ATP-binding protein BacA [Fundidesulfovibrio magnetotacticus]